MVPRLLDAYAGVTHGSAVGLATVLAARCWTDAGQAREMPHLPDEGATVPMAELQQWIDKLEIRELIERSMRYMDDEAGARAAELFAEDGVLQLAGTVFAGRDAIRNMFGHTDPPRWTEPGELLKQPGASHWSSNPVIEVSGDYASAETDMLVVKRTESGKATITLVARYRDRLRRTETGWVLLTRTGVSLARPGEEGTDGEWARALERMSPEIRAQFRAT